METGANVDLGQIFRIITGSKLRDVDEDGNLVEQVAHSQAHHHELTAAEERRALREEMGEVKRDVNAVHSKLDGVLKALETLKASR